jgi:hypothetical protein
MDEALNRKAVAAFALQGLIAGHYPGLGDLEARVQVGLIDRGEADQRIATRAVALADALIAALADTAPFDLVAHLRRQRAFSEKTFGPGARTKGVIDHIRKELAEIEADPADIDGAWRAGWEPEQIVKAIVAKQTKNEGRQWPDWREADPDAAIEHVRV